MSARPQVTYNCLQHGQATISMVIPLPMHDDLHFSWKKTCGGLYRQYLSVSTFEKPVVRDGVAYDDWQLVTPTPPPPPPGATHAAQTRSRPAAVWARCRTLAVAVCRPALISVAVRWQEYAGESDSATVDSREDSVSFFLTIDANDLTHAAINTEDWTDWLDSADMPTVPPNMAVQTYQRPTVTTTERQVLPSAATLAAPALPSERIGRIGPPHSFLVSLV